MILIKENGIKVGLFQNKISDNFLANTINGLGLIEANLEVYDFTINCAKICRYEREEDKLYTVDDDKIILKTVQVQAEYEPRIVEVGDLNALDYYSQSFIDDFNANKVAEEAYYAANPEGTEFAFPHLEATVNNLVFGEALVVPAVIIEDEILVGTPVDVAAKIAQES